jgi:hypothetical protein
MISLPLNPMEESLLLLSGLGHLAKVEFVRPRSEVHRGWTS